MVAWILFAGLLCAIAYALVYLIAMAAVRLLYRLIDR